MLNKQFKGWLVAAGAFILTVTAAARQDAEQVSGQRFRQEFLWRINKVRQQGCNCGTTYMPPAPPLVWNDNLQIAAIGHAADMAQQHYFSHTSKDGRNIEDRIALGGYVLNGYKSFVLGENIAWGQHSIQEVTNGWFASVGHCKNLMNPNFKEVGVAENSTYWVQDFGGRESWSAQEQQMIKSGRMIITKQRVSKGHE
jgi:uncharacterized protein YkwD